jgi:hypothetical protein
MDHGTQEITREYRLDFSRGEAEWDDPIPPEVTSGVLGRRTKATIKRTSLLAWSLMNITEVEVADVTAGGWIKIRIRTEADFDEDAFDTRSATLCAG